MCKMHIAIPVAKNAASTSGDLEQLDAAELALSIGMSRVALPISACSRGQKWCHRVHRYGSTIRGRFLDEILRLNSAGSLFRAYSIGKQYGRESHVPHIVAIADEL